MLVEQDYIGQVLDAPVFNSFAQEVGVRKGSEVLWSQQFAEEKGLSGYINRIRIRRSKERASKIAEVYNSHK
jgi:hypothetical protein